MQLDRVKPSDTPSTQLRLAVGSYTSDHSPLGFMCVTYDTATETFSQTQPAELENVSWIAKHPASDVLYVAQESSASTDGRGEIAELRPSLGTYRKVARWPTVGAQPCHLSADPEGHWLVASTYNGPTIEVFEIGRSGEIRSPGPIALTTGHGPHPRQETSHPHSTLWLEGSILALDLGSDTITSYAPENLSRQYSIKLPPGSGPRQAAVVGDTNLLIVVNELSNTVSLVDVSPSGGMLASAPLPEDPPSLAASVTMCPSDDVAYVSTRGNDTVTRVRIDREQRGVTIEHTQKLSGRGPRHIAWMHDRLLVACRDSDDLIVYRHDGLAQHLVEVSRTTVKNAAMVVEVRLNHPLPTRQTRDGLADRSRRTA